MVPQKSVNRNAKNNLAIFPPPPVPAPAAPVSEKKAGRPRRLASPRQFDEAANNYFAHCRENNLPLTMSGLALAMGFSSRQAFNAYEKYQGFSEAVKRARLAVENAYETRLHSASCSGAVFALKNFGWEDKSRLEHSGQMSAPPDLVITPLEPPDAG